MSLLHFISLDLDSDLTYRSQLVLAEPISLSGKPPAIRW